MVPTSAPPTRERLAVLGLTLVGSGLRFWAFGTLGFTHFDEGIYAISALWALTPGGLLSLDPGVIAYAPPGFPFLVGLAYGLLGVSDGAALAVAAFAGVAVIPLVAWVATRTFGPGAGVSAAAFAAFSLAAIAFSRKALTDMPFLACWLLALGSAACFLERPNVVRALALGGAVALAQYFKYNGWLAGGVTIVAAIAGLAVDERQRARGALRRTFGCGVVAALFAAALYVPWVAFVERNGGYSALLRHHRSYMGGVASWLEHWNVQLAEAHALSGAPVFPVVAWSASWCGVWFARRAEKTAQHGWLPFLLGLVVGAVMAPVSSLAWWISLPVALWLVFAKPAAQRVVGAAWLILAGATPFYHPHARLWLPITAAQWVILAGLASAVYELCASGGVRERWRAAPRPARTAAAIAVGVWLALLGVHASLLRPMAMPVDWVLAPGPSLRDATFALTRGGPRSTDDARFLVLARRPVAFYLVLARRQVQLAEGVPALLRPAPAAVRAITDETLLTQESNPPAAKARLESNWLVEDRFQEDLDPVTLLDVDPRAAYIREPKRTYELWRLAPARAKSRADAF